MELENKVLQSSRLNEVKQFIVRNCGSKVVPNDCTTHSKTRGVEIILAKGIVSATRVDCLVSRICVSVVNKFVI